MKPIRSAIALRTLTALLLGLASLTGVRAQTPPDEGSSNLVVTPKEEKNRVMELCRWESRGPQARCYLSFTENDALEKAAKSQPEKIEEHPEYIRRRKVVLYNFATSIMKGTFSKAGVAHLFIITNMKGGFSRENLTVFDLDLTKSADLKAPELKGDSVEEDRKRMEGFMEEVGRIVQSKKFERGR